MDFAKHCDRLRRLWDHWIWITGLQLNKSHKWWWEREYNSRFSFVAKFSWFLWISLHVVYCWFCQGPFIESRHNLFFLINYRYSHCSLELPFFICVDCLVWKSLILAAVGDDCLQLYKPNSSPFYVSFWSKSLIIVQNRFPELRMSI